jgi:hypothetical protein
MTQETQRREPVDMEGQHGTLFGASYAHITS